MGCATDPHRRDRTALPDRSPRRGPVPWPKGLAVALGILLGLVVLGLLAPVLPPRDHPGPAVPHALTPAPQTAASLAQAPPTPGYGGTAAPRAPAIIAPTDAWLLLQGDPERDGSSPDAPPSTSHIAWSQPLPPFGNGATPITAGIVTSGALVYAASGDGGVYAFNARNGSPVWSYRTGGAVSATPEVQRGLLLVGSEDGNLYELNATTGALAGRFPLGSPDQGASPLPVGGLVYAPCWSARVCAFTLGGSASPVWNVSVGGPVRASLAADPAHGDLFVGTTTGQLFDLYLPNGSVRWQYTFTGTNRVITTTPVVGPVPTLGRTVVFAFASATQTSGVLEAFNESSPTVTVPHAIYNATVAAGFGPSSPALASGRLFAATENGKVIAFDPATGTILWNVFPWPGNTGSISASVLDAQGTVVVGLPSPASGGGAVAELAEATGSVSRTISAPTGSVVGSPAVQSSALYFPGEDGTVYAVGSTPPTAPTNLRAVASNQTVQLTWGAPSDDGGIPLTQYALAWGPLAGPASGATTVSGSTLAYAITGLTDGTTYWANVRAVNAEGGGPNATVQAVPGALPAAPYNVHVSLADHKFTLLWTPPSYTGGSPISADVVEYWNESTWAHQNTTITPSSAWVLTGVPNGVVIDARVAVRTAIGPSPYSAVGSGAPWLAPGVLSLIVTPSSARSAVTLTLNGAPLPFSSSNGTARLALAPGTYWVNGSGSGWLGYDQPVVLTSGNLTSLNVTMAYPPRNFLGLTSVEIIALTIVVVVALVLAILALGLRYRRLQRIAQGDEEEEEEEEEGGISAKRARSLLQEEPTAAPGPPEGSGEAGAEPPTAGLEGTGAGPALEGPVGGDTGEIEGAGPASGGAPPTEGLPPAEEEDEEDTEPEGAGGRLGEYLRHRRAEKETLKRHEENTPGEERGPEERHEA